MKSAEYTLKTIYSIFGIEGFVFDSENNLLFHCGTEDKASEEKAVKTCDELRIKLEKTDFPQIYFEEKDLIFWGFTDETRAVCLFGPVTLERFGKQRLEKYKRRYNIRDNDYKIPYADITGMLGMISISCCIMLGKQYSEYEIMEANTKLSRLELRDSVDYQIYRYEESKESMEYEKERKWLKGIEEGKFAKESEIDYGFDIQYAGTVSKANDYKQVEYLMVAAITMMSRAAIRGGVEPAVSLEASDLFLQKLSVCNNVIEMIDIAKRADKKFTEMVRDKKEKQRMGSLTEQCMNYVAGHLYGKFTISDMAQDLSVNRTYLSKYFSQKMGMTIQQYILKERLRTASNLLKYSDRSIGQIADYMQFSSAGRFSGYFKKEYGLTPHEYREKYKEIDFVVHGHIKYT